MVPDSSAGSADRRLPLRAPRRARPVRHHLAPAHLDDRARRRGLAVDVRPWFGDGQPLRPRARQGQLTPGPRVGQRPSSAPLQLRRRAPAGPSNVSPVCWSRPNRNIVSSAGVTGDHHRVVAAGEHGSTARARRRPPDLDRYAGRPHQSLAGGAQRPPTGCAARGRSARAASSPGWRGGCPRGARSTPGCSAPCPAAGCHRRPARRTAADPLDQRGEVLLVRVVAPTGR